MSLKLFKHLFAGFALLASTFSYAAMTVEKSIIHYQPGDPSRQDVQITNPDQETLYVQVEIFEIINPGDENEERRELTNPKEAGFLVTPNKMAVPPGGKKLIRLVNLQPLGEKERILRINLKPIAPDIDAEQTAIKLLIGYQLLVLIQPADVKPSVKVTREGNSLTFVNDGNTNLLFQRGEQCNPASENTNCAELPVFRLYPGNTHVQELPGEGQAQYIMSTGTKNQTVVY